MPIPTKTQSTRLRPEIKSAPKPSSTRHVSSARDTTSSNTTSGGRPPSSTTNSAISQTKPEQSRVLPRSPLKTTTSALRHTRSTSTNNASTIPSGSSAASRASSASSTSTSRVTKDPKQDAPAASSITKPVASRSRLVPGATSTTSTSTARTIPSRIASKPKPNTAPSTSKTLKPPNGPVNTSVVSRRPTTGSSRDAATEKPTESTPSQLHNEIYQLQLIHAQSHTNFYLYQQSIQKKLDARRTALRHQQDQILQLEAQDQEALSIQALHEFLHKPDTNPQISHKPSDKIQILSSAIAELDSLNAPDNTTLLPLQQFEHWLTHALSIRDDRKSNISTHLVFIPGLGHEWSEAIRQLQEILQTLVTTIRSFDIPDETASGIGVVLTQQRRFAETLLQEVETAIVVERAVTKDEVAWEAELLEQAMDELAGVSVDAYTGAWA